MKTFYNTVYAEQLKRIRKECRMTQVELSTHLHISRSCLANYEIGIRTPPSDIMQMVDALCSERKVQK